MGSEWTVPGTRKRTGGAAVCTFPAEERRPRLELHDRVLERVFLQAGLILLSNCYKYWFVKRPSGLKPEKGVVADKRSPGVSLRQLITVILKEEEQI